MRIVGGVWAGHSLVSPGKRVRPTHEDVRDAWMNLLSNRLDNARVVDLFAGSGGIGLEALSRGAASADFVDDSREALHALKANIARRKLKPLKPGERPSKTRKAARIFKRDAIPFTARLQSDAYDVAFADPPYGSRKLDRIIATWMSNPFSDVLGVEHAPDHRLPKGAQQLRFESSFVTLYLRP